MGLTGGGAFDAGEGHKHKKQGAKKNRTAHPPDIGGHKPPTPPEASTCKPFTPPEAGTCKPFTPPEAGRCKPNLPPYTNVNSGTCP